jgi:hypothetical protein
MGKVMVASRNGMHVVMSDLYRMQTWALGIQASIMSVIHGAGGGRSHYDAVVEPALLG